MSQQGWTVQSCSAALLQLDLVRRPLSEVMLTDAGPLHCSAVDLSPKELTECVSWSAVLSTMTHPVQQRGGKDVVGCKAHSKPAIGCEGEYVEEDADEGDAYPQQCGDGRCHLSPAVYQNLTASAFASLADLESRL